MFGVRGMRFLGGTGGGGSSFYDFTLGTLPAGISFAAASTRTNFNSSGTLVTVATDVPRFSYRLSGGVWVPEGLLIEGAATNNVQRSAEIDNAYWSKVRASITANGAVAPDGTTTMDKLVEDNSNNSHYASVSHSFVAGTTYAIEFFALASGRNFLMAQLPSAAFTSFLNNYFDFSSGALGTAGAGCTNYVRHVGGNIYRCSVLAVATITATNIPVFSLASNGSTVSYLGDGASGVYLWGVEVKEIDCVTSLIPTTSAAVTRAADIAVLTNPSALSDQCQVIKFRTPRRISGGAANVAWQRDDGTTSNREAVVYGSDGKVHVIAARGGVTQCDLDMGAVAADTDVTIVPRFTTGAFAASLNGGALVSYGGGIRPDGLTTARLGQGVSGSALNSTIRSLQTWPTASDTQLPLLAA
jgi:hypothetical protein